MGDVTIECGLFQCQLILKPLSLGQPLTANRANRDRRGTAEALAAMATEPPRADVACAEAVNATFTRMTPVTYAPQLRQLDDRAPAPGTPSRSLFRLEPQVPRTVIRQSFRPEGDCPPGRVTR